jgi:apolipoprotein D and lipocalin family protein
LYFSLDTMVRLSLALLAGLSAASKCPSSVTPICSDLDLQRYAGVWYEQVNSKAFTIDANLRCVTAEYSANDDGSVKVLNKGAKDTPTGELSVAEGKATVKDLSTCSLGVKFSSLQPVDAPYQIFDTDYDTYSVVISCIPVANLAGLSDIWILSRTPKLPQATLDSIMQKLKDAGFDYSDMRLQVQEDDCNYGVQRLSVEASLPLVTFDGSAGTSFDFKALNDPVMGGKSTGSWALGDGFGILDGEVVDVPSLSAPGFIKAAADGKFPDVSAAFGGSLVLNVRSSTPEYSGYRVTFVSGATSASFACAAGGSLPLSRGCFKAKFSVPAGSDFVQVKIPFTDFSDKWSSATGEQTTTCAQSADVCPTASKLSKIQRVEFWGEGANGKLHLEVQSVFAEDASGNSVQLV